MSKDISDYERFSQRLSYDKETGIFRFLPKPDTSNFNKAWNSMYAGKVCGKPDSHGYLMANLITEWPKREPILLHRLAWFMVYGKPPQFNIDHLNGVRADNRIENLRDVKTTLNNRNTALTHRNTSGISGISWLKRRNKWAAKCMVDGKLHYLGEFVDIEDAKSVLSEFRLANGFTSRHGVATYEAAQGKTPPPEQA